MSKIFVTDEEIRLLPRMVQLSLGSICVQKLLPLIYKNNEVRTFIVTSLTKVRALIENPDYSTISCERNAIELLNLMQTYKSANWENKEAKILSQAALLVIDSALDDVYDRYLSMESHMKIALAINLCGNALKEFPKLRGLQSAEELIRGVYNRLFKLSDDDSWDDTPVPASVFKEKF